MPLKSYKPTSPGRRLMTSPDFSEITKSRPEKKLTLPLNSTGGRNVYGRMTTRHRGGGHKQRIRIVDWKREKVWKPVPWDRTIIYETHVRGFTMRHPEVPRDLRGTYAGLAHPAAIDRDRPRCLLFRARGLRCNQEIGFVRVGFEPPGAPVHRLYHRFAPTDTYYEARRLI